MLVGAEQCCLCMGKLLEEDRQGAPAYMCQHTMGENGSHVEYMLQSYEKKLQEEDTAA